MKNRNRYIIVMVLCVIFNELFYNIAVALGLPVWLDTTGTALASVLLEPAAGMLVGLANNFYLAIVNNDASRLMYYFVTAAEAIIVGNLMRKNGKVSMKRFLPTIGLTALVTSLMVTGITLWRNEGGLAMPSDIAAYNMFRGIGCPSFLATFAGPVAVKLLDVAAQGVIVLVLYLITPNILRHPSDIKNK